MNERFLRTLVQMMIPLYPTHKMAAMINAFPPGLQAFLLNMSINEYCYFFTPALETIALTLLSSSVIGPRARSTPVLETIALTLLSSSVIGPRAISTPILLISRLAYCFLLPLDLKISSLYTEYTTISYYRSKYIQFISRIQKYILL